MSVPTAELTAPTAAPPLGAPVGGIAARLSAGRLYLLAVAFALAVAALSLLIPSTPSYDPWSWLLWGREIVHLDLQTTGGPTWKPLPMIFTIPFALFGRAAPDLWLVVARAGAIMSVLMVFTIAARITRQLLTPLDALGKALHAGGTRSARSLFLRGSVLAPAILAGLIAGVSLALSGGYLSDSALGYSEGLLTASVLIAVERHLAGHHRQAFAMGFFAALDRPEIWAFWGPYGLWLWWKDPGARRLVIGLFVLIPVFWFLPTYWGSGHFFQGVTRAHNPRSNSPAFAHCPFCTELVSHAWPTVLLRLKAPGLLAVGAASGLLWRAMRARRRWRLQTPREQAQATLVVLGLAGLAWWVVIALLTQAGFSGNDRYLVLGAALIDIAGAAGWVWAVYEIAAVIWRWRQRQVGADVAGAGAPVAGGVMWGVAALATLAFMFVPNWVVANYVQIPETHRALVYQAHLREDVTNVVRRYGRSRILACGTVMTEGFQVPMVAYTLGVHILRVWAPPTGPPFGPAPNVILQTRATRDATLLPELQDWPNVHYRLVTRERTFNVYASCKGNLKI